MDGSVRQLSHEELVRLVMRLQAELTELREENRRLKHRFRTGEEESDPAAAAIVLAECRREAAGECDIRR